MGTQTIYLAGALVGESQCTWGAGATGLGMQASCSQHSSGNQQRVVLSWYEDPNSCGKAGQEGFRPSPVTSRVHCNMQM